MNAHAHAYELERAEEVSESGKTEHVVVTFKGQHDTLESVFGSEPIDSDAVVKKLWKYLISNKLLKVQYR